MDKIYCQHGTELIRELKRSKKWLPPYNEEALRQVSMECHSCFESMKKSYISAQRAAQETGHQGIPDNINVTVQLLWQSILRNKRCGLAYLNYRLQKVKDIWWDTGVVLPEELKSVLSNQENKFLNKYDEIMNEYMAEVDLTLTTDQHPPKELYVEVRALKDLGEIQTEDGPVKMEAHTMHLLRRTDAELLIRQGALIQTDKK